MSHWWDNAVIYEVYPRSFADADGDGIGDLPGVIRRMPYLASIGIQAIWLTPFQRSPQVDQGYDISDYCDVDPLFGTLADMEALLDVAHANGIRVLVDIVPNHTSVENPLFRDAIEAGPGSDERDMFLFSEGRGAKSENPANNWVSVFGGPAWRRAAPDSPHDRQWYLHLFSPAQPDWNWHNPKVVEYFENVIRFWFDKGADGIRVDVAHGLFKAPGLPDSPSVPVVVDGLRSNPLAMDQELVHEVYRNWRRVADEYSPARLLVGEVNLEPERAVRYTRSDELHQTFAFAFAKLGWDARQWVAVGQQLEGIRRSSGSAPSWALENHDIVRTATRFGGGARGHQRARAALVALLGLPGTVYIYQGQELGLPEVDVPGDQRADPMWFYGGLSRDGARVPLPWTASASGAHGFSPVGSSQPWLPVPEGWGAYSVEQQIADGSSTLALFREAAAARARIPLSGIVEGALSLEWSLDADGRLLALRSDGVCVVVAMGGAAVALPPGRVLVASESLVGGKLPPDAAAWVASR